MGGENLRLLLSCAAEHVASKKGNHKSGCHGKKHAMDTATREREEARKGKKEEKRSIRDESRATADRDLRRSAGTHGTGKTKDPEGTDAEADLSREERGPLELRR